MNAKVCRPHGHQGRSGASFTVYSERGEPLYIDYKRREERASWMLRSVSHMGIFPETRVNASEL
jgi:hypothetical protein